MHIGKDFSDCLALNIKRAVVVVIVLASTFFMVNKRRSKKFSSHQ